MVVVVLVIGVGLPVVNHEGAVGVVVLEVIVVLDEVVSEGGADLKWTRLDERTQEVKRVGKLKRPSFIATCLGRD